MICPFLTFLCVGWFSAKVVTNLEDRGLIVRGRALRPRRDGTKKPETNKGKGGIKMMNLSYSALAETKEMVYSQLFPSCQIIFQLITFLSVLVTYKIRSNVSFSFPQHSTDPLGSEDVVAQN